MYKETKEFIKQRQLYSPQPVEYVIVKNMGGGISNDCYGNSYKLRLQDKNYFMVSGWLILPYSKVDKCVKVVQHWFNINLKTIEYVDTSPVEKNAEYVADMNLYKYCTENDEKMKTHVALSLIYEDERFKSVRNYNDKEQIVNEIDNLTAEELYKFSMHY